MSRYGTGLNAGALKLRVYNNFRGVDFTGGDVDNSRSPDALNMWKNYKHLGKLIETRPGISQEVELDGDVFIAVGKAETRKKLMERDANRNFPVLIHPSAVVAKRAEIAAGSVVMAGAVINPGAQIGKGCIINTSSSVDHDCLVGDYVHISVGAHLSGTVVVGTGTWIGAGAIVSNNVNICGECVIGAGAVVIKDIDEPGTYVGVPAKLKN
jgi:sugar O-acyltransferase (sialic acid O-acetyltransferase NeuD family)